MFPLTLDNARAPKEKTYFTLAVILAALLWLVLVALSFGTIFLILLILAVIVWFSNGLLVAGLRAEAVAVHPQQLAELDEAFREVCATLGVEKKPALYIVQAGGVLNAFATRHAGRHFVVVYSDMLEALGPNSAEMKFLLGHEIGHIQRHHVMWRLLLAPALFLPLIGPAYSRSCETTCDRFGALAAGNVTAALTAMMILAGGKQAGKVMDPEHFADQNAKLRGFFISWYELISGYPTLSRRVNDLKQLRDSGPAPRPPRHPLAYLFAFFTFGGGFGGRGSFVTTLILIYIVGILAAMALPAISMALKKGRAAHLTQQAQSARGTSVDAQLDAIAAQMNAKGSKSIDESTTLTGVESRSGKTFVYKYSLALEKSTVEPGALDQLIRPKLLDAYQHGADLKFFRDNGVTLVYHYEDKNGETIGDVTIGPKDLVPSEKP